MNTDLRLSTLNVDTSDPLRPSRAVLQVATPTGRIRSIPLTRRELVTLAADAARAIETLERTGEL